MLRRPLVSTLAALALAALWPAGVSAGSYQVRWGDSLTLIASRFGTTVHTLAAANRLDPSRTLLAGSVLQVPSAQQGAYVVRPGDTLGHLALRFGTTVHALASANRLDPNRFLLAGSTLRVPGGAATAPSVAAAASARYSVRLGDSLSAIAARFGTSVPALASANSIDPARLLLAGTTLTVPQGAGLLVAAAARQPVSQGQVRSLIVDWANRYGVDTRLALALSWMESGYQATVVSSAGAFGPMQVTQATRGFVEAVLVGSPIPQTTSGDVQAGVAYLHYLLGRFGGDERLALAGYFQGPESVNRGLLPATRAYIADVLALMSRV